MRLVNPFTLILLTVSTSSTFEISLFPPYKYRPWGGCLIYTWRAKLCWWIVYRSLWSSETQNPLVAEEFLSQTLGCNLNSFHY